MSFSERNGYRRKYPDRIRLEQVSDDVRLVLKDALTGNGWLPAYHALCEYNRTMPDEDLWSDKFAKQPAQQMLAKLEWYEVFDLLEEHAGHLVDEVNDAFARSGLAYEATEDTYPRRGKCSIAVFDPDGVVLEVSAVGDETSALLTDRFEPVRKQYVAALDALQGRPSDFEKAISESVGALEAVARILAHKKDFGANLTAIMANENPDHGWLKPTLGALYGFASQVPGARHGRWADPAIQQADAAATVRLAGVAITYLIEGDRMNRWPTTK